MSSTPEPVVSVLIRVRNEAVALERALSGLASQRLNLPWEIVVLDNESDDGSADIAVRNGARVFVLPRQLFGYGRAINVGLEHCRGEFVILQSAHAWPIGGDWLDAMVRVLQSQPDLAGAYCRQIPLGSVCRQERGRFDRFDGTPYILTASGLSDAVRIGADPYEVCRFSNSACIVRRDVATATGYRDLPYAEDRAFVLDVVVSGYKVAYVPAAVVSYERPHSAATLYHVARRAQISKHLIREIATASFGRQMQKSELASRVLRVLLKPAATVAQIICSPLVDRGVEIRACQYALASWGTTVGLLRGEMSWRRHRGAAGCDASALRLAQQCIYAHPDTTASPSATGQDALT